MPSFQKYFAMGHLGRDIEFEQTSTGNVWARFSLAVSSGWGDKKTTLWVNCKCFGKTAERLQNFAPWPKGKLLLVEGEWRRDEVEKDGAKQSYYWVDVRDWHFVERKSGEAEAGGEERAAKPSKPKREAAPKQESLADWKGPADDDIPF